MDVQIEVELGFKIGSNFLMSSLYDMQTDILENEQFQINSAYHPSFVWLCLSFWSILHRAS